jgi:hypothetical protein
MKSSGTSTLSDSQRWAFAMARWLRLCRNFLLISTFTIVVYFNIQAYRSYDEAGRLSALVRSQTGDVRKDMSWPSPGMIVSTILTALFVGKVVCNRRAWRSVPDEKDLNNFQN